MKTLVVSPSATSRLAEILWPGTNLTVKHSADGTFRCIGSYYLWLRTQTMPQVRFWSYAPAMMTLLNAEPSLDLQSITPDQEQRIATAVYMLLTEHGLISEFTDPELSIIYHESTPSWYITVLNNLRAKLAT